MVFSTVSGVNTPALAAVATTQSNSQPQTVVVAKVVKDNKSVQSYVTNYFSDLPIMVDIAYCESRFRQYDKDGEIFRGLENDQDVGVMQINEHYHLDTATEGNYNLYSIEGNTAYARKLYEKYGTTPWNSSKPCWGKYVNQSDDVKVALALTKMDIK